MSTWVNKGSCSECKQEFVNWHLASKATCSPKCRKRRERRQKDQHSAHVMAFQELQKMRDGIKRRETLEDYRTQLNYLKNEINDLLLLAGDRDSIDGVAMLEGWARKHR